MQPRQAAQSRCVRKKVVGTAERPRLQIHRTLHHIYASRHRRYEAATRCSSRLRRAKKTLSRSGFAHSNVDAAQRKVGDAIGKKAKAAGIDTVVFDTSGLKYHGRVAALADAAREAGLEF